jgi:hypothetical protein
VRPELPYPLLPDELKDQSESRIPEESSPRAALLRHFAYFVSHHLGLLVESPDDTLPLANNNAEDPVAERAEQQIAEAGKLCLKRPPRPPASPLRPQSLRTG